MSIALRKLAERRGKPISLEEYCERFEKSFHLKYGALTTSGLLKVAQELGLCSWAHTFLDIGRAKRYVRKSSGLFVITEKFWHLNVRSWDGAHARLALDYEIDKWVLWEHRPHDREGHKKYIRDDDLIKDVPHFIAFDVD
jgi:hypothetical protein